MGTFDFGPPSSLDHYILDIKPWLIWGNSPQDTTTYQDRAGALGTNIIEFYERQL